MAKATGTEEVLDFLDEIGEVESAFEKAEDKSNVHKVFVSFGERLRKNLDKDKRNASGNLYQSVGGDSNGTWDIKKRKGGVNIKMWLPDYYEYTDIGRKPTQKEGSGVVEKKLKGLTGWISQKKIVKSSGMKFLQKWELKDGTIKTKYVKKTAAQANKILAFLFSRKIHKKGFKGSKWFTREVPYFEKNIYKAVEKDYGKF
jgi:hypothetical protein